MKILAEALSDVGRRRDHNEDHYLVDDELGLFIVCDGMGGHAAGEVASALAAKTIQEAVRAELGKAEGHDEPLDPWRAAHIVEVLRRAVEAANAAVHRLGSRDPNARGAGTTCTVLSIRGQRGVLAHVGDSRLYLRRGGQLHQLSMDHSFVADAMMRGYTREQALEAFPSNLLMRAVGPLERVQVDTLEFDVLPGDIYLVCSDGLHGYFDYTSQGLGEMLEGEGIAERLVDYANQRGGEDNITAVVVHIESEDAAGEERLSRVYEDLSALSAMELFGELEYPELLEVASALRTEELEKDVTVLTEGEASKALYVIAAGRVSVEKGGTQLTTLSSGSHFGEMALLTNRPRTATVKTLEPTRLLVLDQDAVYPLFQANPVIGVKFLWRLGQVQSLRLDEATLLLRPPASKSDGLDFSGESTQRLFPPPFSKRRPED